GSGGLSGDALLHNTGTIEKLGGARPGYLRVTLDNDGTVVSSAGDLAIESDSAVTQAGAFVSSGASSSITLSDGVLALEPSVTFDGQFVIADGELRIPAGMTLAVPAGKTLRMTGGAIGGAGTLSVARTLDWQGGEQTGGGATLIAAGGSAVVKGGVYAALREDRSLVNRGS